jgi:hypothetical protein
MSLTGRRKSMLWVIGITALATGLVLVLLQNFKTSEKQTSITFETEFVSVGSTNFDIRLIQLNVEASLNIYSSDFATQMTAVFQADLLAAETYSHARGRTVGCAKSSPKRFCYPSNRSFDRISWTTHRPDVEFQLSSEPHPAST